MKKMTLSELYETVGEDLSDVIERLGDIETVEHFLFVFKDDPSYSRLIRSLKEHDLQRAFSEAHTLKGVSLSLGFKRLGDCSGALCEKLREGNAPPESLLMQLKTEYCRLIDAISNFKKYS